MTTQTKHTSLPWVFSYGSIYQSADEPIEENGTRIAMMDRNTPDTTPTERDANAAFIVKACNTHYQLVEACKAGRRYNEALARCSKEGQFERLPTGAIATGDDLDDLWLDWNTKIHQALALAEKGME